MAQKIEALRGMDDLLPGEIESWQWLEELARVFFESRGYKEIRTPVLEFTDLFVRSVGESSDIVHKEMFSFEDRGGRQVTLRPEMTASVARSVIEKSLLTQAKSLRLYYLGPMFRAERPQAGRKRQFHQIGIEIVNESGEQADFECIALLYEFLHYAGLKNLTLKLNDLGDEAAQKKMAAALRDYFSSVKDQLCKDCHWRLEKNVLRIFDCKVNTCQPVIDQAPWEKIAPLSESFQKLLEHLKVKSIKPEIHRRLVRGLDYYNGPVFEIASASIGAQDAVAGGGRYDRLYRDLGGAVTPCTGFSIGMERLIAALEKEKPALSERVAEKRVYIAPASESDQVTALCQQAALKLRARGIRLEMSPGESSMIKHLKKANKKGLRFVVICGDAEASKGVYLLKDLKEKKQEEMTLEALMIHLERVWSK